MDKSETKKGLLIVAMGLPSVGKSSVIKELGKLLGCKTLLEKEESYWGQAVKDMSKNKDNFTGNMFFRSMRVPYYHEAQRDIDNGQLVLLDTFYDKLSYLYMEDKGNFNWLFDYDSPYYNPLKEISKMDYETLPDADYLIFIDIDKDVWEKFALKRGRDLDKDEKFKKSYLGIKSMKDAVYNKYKHDLKEKGKELTIIEVKQAYDSANRVALKVFAKLLQEHKIKEYLKQKEKINDSDIDGYIKNIIDKYDDPKDYSKGKAE